MSYFYAFNGVGNDLKWRPRLKIYKSGSVQFDPATCEAYSYNWCFVKRINGKLVFNDYRYSPTTTRHQWAVKALLKSLKIKIDVVVDCNASLNSSDAGPQAVEAAIRAAAQSGDFSGARVIARCFRVPFSRAVIGGVIETMEVEQCDAYLRRAFQYSEDKLQKILKRLGAPVYRPEFNQPAEPETAGTTSEVFPWAA